MKKYIIYHDKCPDGLTAAALFKIHAYKYNYEDIHNYEFIPGNYNMTLSDLDIKPDSIIYFLDFSFKKDMFTELLNKAHTIFLLDHHKTAYDELHTLFSSTKLKVYFDLKECGSSLTYKYLYPETPLPKIIEHIKDQDLWLWRDPDSKFFCAYLSTLDFTLDGFYKFYRNYFSFPNKADIYNNYLFVGKKLLEVHQKDALGCIDTNLIKRDIPNIGESCIINCPSKLTGYVKTELVENRQEKVLITYAIGSKGMRISIRVSNDMDAIKIAKMIDPIKAGGHPLAAGAFIPLEEFNSHWFTKLIFSL